MEEQLWSTGINKHVFPRWVLTLKGLLLSHQSVRATYKALTVITTLQLAPPYVSSSSLSYATIMDVLPPIPHYLDVNILRQTRSAAQRLLHKLRPHAKVSSLKVSLGDLTLLLPAPLAPRLVAVGLQKSHALLISSALDDAALKLKRSFAATYESRRRLLETEVHELQPPGFSFKIPSTFAAVYTKTIENWSSYLLDELAPRILRAQAARERSRSKAPSVKRPFNQVSSTFPSIILHKC